MRTGQATARTVAALTASGATVLTMRLPDPAQMFGLPAGLARPLSRRMRAVNAELDRIAAHYGTVHWDASTDPETYDRRNWSVDRLHPNERGHRLIAGRMWDRLAAAGVPGGQPARRRADQSRADPRATTCCGWRPRGLSGSCAARWTLSPTCSSWRRGRRWSSRGRRPAPGVPDWRPPVRGSQASIQASIQSGIQSGIPSGIPQTAEPVAE